jgi:hypothetical protein
VISGKKMPATAAVVRARASMSLSGLRARAGRGRVENENPAKPAGALGSCAAVRSAHAKDPRPLKLGFACFEQAAMRVHDTMVQIGPAEVNHP